MFQFFPSYVYIRPFININKIESLGSEGKCAVGTGSNKPGHVMRMTWSAVAAEAWRKLAALEFGLQGLFMGLVGESICPLLQQKHWIFCWSLGNASSNALLQGLLCGVPNTSLLVIHLTSCLT
jgi:hypothetical protein